MQKLFNIIKKIRFHYRSWKKMRYMYKKKNKLIKQCHSLITKSIVDLSDCNRCLDALPSNYIEDEVLEYLKTIMIGIHHTKLALVFRSSKEGAEGVKSIQERENG